MSSTPDGKHLYPILEGATVVDPDTRRRFMFELSIDDGEFTGRVWQYHTEQPGYLVADMWALDQYRMVLIERDGGRGLTALFRNVYVVDLRDVGPDGFQETRGYPTLVGRSAQAADTKIAAALWTASEELTGTSFPADDLH